MRRSAARLDGPSSPWIGANFWSRSGGPLMWRNYDSDLIRAELRVLREHGVTMTRSFCYWPDFMPEHDRIDERLVEHYRDFLDRHTELGMASVPTFVVGHMSGENWDPAWRAGRHLYADVWLVARQAWFVREIVRRLGDHPAVCGWLLSNEMPIYGGEDSPPETVAAWAQLLIDAVRAGGGSQPVSIGDGAWGLEITGRDNGFRLRDTAALCDFLGPHVYSTEDDLIRQHYAAAFRCELAGTFGRPVVLEEFGTTSDFTSDEHGAHYYRQTLYNTLLAGATGWIAWNNSDYDNLGEQDPYRHHPFEMHFGLTDVTGAPKPQLAEIKAFADTLRAIDVASCRRADAEVALVAPSYLDTVYPFTETEDRVSLPAVLRQSYVTARLADLPPALVRESDGIRDGAALYLVPSTKQLLTPSWRTLAKLAEDGACVYVSYSSGTHEVQRGPWYADLNGMFGVEHQLWYGLADPITDNEVTFTLTRAFGTLAEGTTLTFATVGSGRVFLPVRPVTAEVLAVDGHGRPALLLRRCGAGSVVLCTYPIEQLAVAAPRVNPEHTSVLYAALAAHACVRPTVGTDDQRLAVDLLEHADGRRFVFVVNHCADEVTVKPALPIAATLRTLDGADPGDPLRLPPFGVGVYRLHDATSAATSSGTAMTARLARAKGSDTHRVSVPTKTGLTRNPP